MKKVLLTGASGFLGKNLTPYLTQQGYNVVPIGSNVYDLRDMYACKKAIKNEKPDVIVHAAGSVGGIGANQENPGKFMYENLAMGANMIEAARQHDVEKFVMLGTVCAYPKFTPVPFKEEDLWNGYPEETNAPYGIAKKALMKLGETYNEQYGMDVVNLIPVNMYGPYDHFNLTSSHVIPALILKFYQALVDQSDKVQVWGTGKASREFLYAPDCCEAIELAIQKNVGPEPINIGTGKEISIMDLTLLIAQIMEFSGEVHFDASKPDGQPRRCLDTSKAKELLGFEAKHSLEHGLMETCAYFLKTRLDKIPQDFVSKFSLKEMHLPIPDSIKQEMSNNNLNLKKGSS
jgi:GDP-L-fucose synthase